MPKKKEFEWKEGGRLAPDDYDALGNVRDSGFSKLADGIYADPVRRKEQRKKKLTRPFVPKPAGFFLEESESGLHQEITPSEAARYIHKEEKGIRGILRFTKPATPKGKKKSPTGKK